MPIKQSLSIPCSWFFASCGGLFSSFRISYFFPSWWAAFSSFLCMELGTSKAKSAPYVGVELQAVSLGWARRAETSQV